MLRRTLKHTALLIIACCTPALGQERPPQPAAPALPAVSLPAELDRVLRDYERAWRAGDAAALAALFTTDGFVPTRGGWVRGTASIQRTYGNANGDLRLRALAYATQDTVGYIIGSFHYGETTEPDRGKFILALRRTAGGQWLIAADLDG